IQHCYSAFHGNDIVQQKQQRVGPMSLWMLWWNAIWMLRPAFSHLRTFLWFAAAVAGFTVRTELLGVTSIVRALNLDPRCYNALVDYFHSSAVKLDRLTALWTQLVLRLFPQKLRVNGRYVLVSDGIKIPKCGRKMPAVKLLHQQSDSNTKPEYIMGHSLQAVSLLVPPPSRFLIVNPPDLLPMQRFSAARAGASLRPCSPRLGSGSALGNRRSCWTPARAGQVS